jgi:hypothetical protein
MWAVAGVFLLKSAVPLLASQAAQMRGVSVAEICSVYGVAVRAPSGHAEHGHHDHGTPESEGVGEELAGAHAGDHCALIALALGTTPGAGSSLWQQELQSSSARFDSDRGAWAPDAIARWAARLEHGPPPSA